MLKPGFGGNAPELRQPRDLDGRNLRDLEPQVWRFDTLDRLLARETIEPHHHLAGRKLQFDWETGSTTPCISSQNVRGSRNASLGPSDTKLAAMARYAAAMASLGPMAKNLVLAIVIRNETIEFAATEHHVHSRAFTGAFLAAIDQLAHHYGLCLTNGRIQASAGL